MILEINKDWTQLNNKMSTKKFGTFIRQGSNVEITYETTPVVATKGKVYTLHQTINVDPSIVVHIRSLGTNTVLTLDENFYEEEGSSSSNDNITSVPVIFKIEEEQDWMTGGSFVPILNIYAMDGTTKINPATISASTDNMYKYRGKIESISATTTTMPITVGVNNAFEPLYTYGDFNTTSPFSSTPVQMYANQLGAQLEIEFFYQKSTFRWMLTPTSFNLLSDYAPINMLGMWSTNGIGKVVTKNLSLSKSGITTYLSPTYTNDVLMDNVESAYNYSGVGVARLVKFLNPDDSVLLDTGNSRGTIIFDIIIDSDKNLSPSANVAKLKMEILYNPVLDDGTSSMVTYIPLNETYDFSLSASIYKIDKTHVFYDLDNWEFIKNSENSLGIQEIECKFKVEHKQYTDSDGVTVYDIPSIEIYDLADNPLKFETTKKYFGKIIDIESYTYTDTELRVNVNNDYYYIELNGFYDTSSTTTSDLYLDDILLNQTFEIKFDSNSDVVITNQDYINLLNVSENIPTNVSQNQIKNIIETRINTQKRSPTIFNASNVATNDNLLIFLTSAWYSNNTVVVRNLKFTNYDFAGASGNIYGNVYFDFVRSSADVPLATYFLKVTIVFKNAVNNVTKLERYFTLNFNSSTSKYTISTTETFYDESKWKFYKVNQVSTGDLNVTVTEGTENVKIVDDDLGYRYLYLQLERIGLALYHDITLDLEYLRSDTSNITNITIYDTWLQFYITSNEIHVKFDASQSGKTTKISNGFWKN